MTHAYITREDLSEQTEETAADNAKEHKEHLSLRSLQLRSVDPRGVTICTTLFKSKLSFSVLYGIFFTILFSNQNKNTVRAHVQRIDYLRTPTCFSLPLVFTSQQPLAQLFIVLGADTQATTDGPRGPGGASRVSGGRDEPRSLSTKRRWIPPSTVRRDALIPENRNDLIFRKVRGILNKLTPDKFQKLSDDLLRTELNSSVILKGVILLIFEKALDEPKYSSMYAQLCKRLSEEAPNFEPVPSPCTFRLLLLNKCRAEFENRSKAFEAFERDGPLAPEEEERRQLAKRKMLGNIKFIGELCKLEILAEGILHSCIQQLLQKKSGCSVRDRAEDLECLCQIMKTCGRILDSDKGQKLMDQYFQRMAVLADNQELPLRFRFMLRDAVELRQNKWVPRKATSTEGPMPINLIHDEDPRGRVVKFQLGSGGVPGGGSIMYGHPLKRGDVGDLLSSYPLSSSSFPIPSPNDKFSFGGNGYPSVYGRQRQRQEQNFYSGGGGRQNFNQNHKQNHNSNSQQQQQNFNNSSSKDLPPRFKNRMLLTSSQGQSPEEVSLRPAANSLSNQVNSKPPMGLNIGRPMGLMSDPLMAPPSLKTSSPLLHKEQILIKQASLDRSKSGKKDKGPTKDEVLKKIESLMEEYSKTSNVKEALSAYREQKIPDRFISQVLLTMMVQTLDKNDSARELAGNLIVELKKETLITSAQFLEAFNELVGQMSEKEKEIPRIYSYVAGFAAHAVSNELASLAEFSDVTENGAHFPLFMLILQQLHKTQGKAKLTQIFNDSKVNLLNMLPEVDRTKDRLSEILEERGLSFLFPLLRIQSELWKQLQADPNPTTFYKWIRDNLEPSHHTDPGFINALMTVLLQYITQESIGTEAPGAVPDKQLLEKEKGLLEKFKLVLQAFLHDHLKLQVIAVYSLQVYCFAQQFPKGMLLRWFVNLYDLEIIEEEAFLQWKEDLNEEYPGKGKALFQVNQWLTWLAEAESEEEEEGED